MPTMPTTPTAHRALDHAVVRLVEALVSGDRHSALVALADAQAHRAGLTAMRAEALTWCLNEQLLANHLADDHADERAASNALDRLRSRAAKA